MKNDNTLIGRIHEKEILQLCTDYALWLKERREIFRQSTGTNKTLHLTLVSPYGVKPGKNSFVIQNTVEMDDLFK